MTSWVRTTWPWCCLTLCKSLVLAAPISLLARSNEWFPASEVLLEMMHQKCVGAKCLISIPARWVGAL